jgi:hypothetical protein
MTEHHDSWQTIAIKTATVILGWFGSWKLGEVQTLVGIASGLIVAGYAATQWYVLWRDKIKGPPK